MAASVLPIISKREGNQKSEMKSSYLIAGGLIVGLLTSSSPLAADTKWEVDRVAVTGECSVSPQGQSSTGTVVLGNLHISQLTACLAAKCDYDPSHKDNNACWSYETHTKTDCLSLKVPMP
jgi:hypothetical protein